MAESLAVILFTAGFTLIILGSIMLLLTFKCRFRGAAGRVNIGGIYLSACFQ